MSKVLFATLLVLIALVAVAVAGPMTWSKPLPSATQSTLGSDQKLEIDKAAMTEMRDRVKKLGVFVGYTSQGN